MEQTENETALSGLSLNEFLGQINQDRPEITGGCVLLVNSSSSTAMILMALKITLKRSKDAGLKRLLKKKIRFLATSQVRLFQAAESDLKIFNEYRATLKSKSKNRATKLISNMKRATESLVDAGALLTKAIDEARSTLEYIDGTVISDVQGGLLILEATLKAIRNMEDSNRHAMQSHSH
jgi:formiminotetrahydrofolate cyclodeaminase